MNQKNFLTGAIVLSLSALFVLPSRSLAQNTSQYNCNNYIRADSNLSGEVDIADPIFTLTILFITGADFGCKEAANANADADVDIADAIYTLSYLFLGSVPQPPPPFPNPGTLPPVLNPVGNKTVALGSVINIQLRGSDPEGQPVTFSVSPSPLPENALLNSATGIFHFHPEAGQAGIYTLTFRVSDGRLTDSETITLTVTSPQPGGQTSLSGLLVDTNDFIDAGHFTPVVNATVSILGSGISAQSDATGRFVLAGIPAGDQLLDIDSDTAVSAPDGSKYADFREKIVIIEGVANVVDRPFFLPRIAMDSLETVDPDGMTMVENAQLGIMMEVPAHTAKDENGNDYTGELSISEVPEGLAPAAMPEEFNPGLLITIQPVGVSYITPVPITFPNIDNLPAGTELDIWSLDPNLGGFVIVGKGRVTPDGRYIETIEGGIRANDWHFVLPPTGMVDGSGNNGENIDPAKAGHCGFGSEASICSGNLREEHALVSYRSFGEEKSLALIYDSSTADPRPIITSNITISALSAVPQNVSAKLRVGGIDSGLEIFTNTSSLNEDINETIRQVVQFDAGDLQTGIYPYRLMLTNKFTESSISSILLGNILVNNQNNSIFGSGWGVSSLYRIKKESDGSLLMFDGKHSVLHFTRSGAGSALQFDGTNDYANISSNLRNLGILDMFTISIWIKSSASGGMQMLLEDGWQFNSDAIYLGVSPNSNQIFVRLNTSGGSQFWDFIPVPSFADIWSNVTFTYDGSQLIVYFNGSIVYQAGISGAVNSGDRIFLIGYPSGESFYKGAIDELKIWNKALTQDQIIDGLSKALLGNEEGLLGYWQFNEGSGQQILNTVTEGVNGFLGGTLDPDSSDPQWIESDAPINCAASASCEFTSPRGDYSKIFKQANGAFIRELKDGTRYEFNALGLQTSMVDRNGNTTSYEYDAQERLIRIIDPKGFFTSIQYPNPRQVRITDPANRVTLLEKDANGDLAAITDPDGTVRRFEYDSRHRMTAQISKRGHRTEYTPNFASRYIQSRRPDGSVMRLTPIETIGLVDTSTGVGTRANPAPVTRPAEAAASFTDGRNFTTRFTTDRFGASTSATDALNRTTTIARDQNSNPVTITAPGGAVTRMTYDEKGNLRTVNQEGISALTQFFYEPNFNQLRTIFDPMGIAANFFYDANGNPTQIADNAGTNVLLVYEDVNCKGEVTRAARAFNVPGMETSTSFQYDPDTCSLEAVTDPLGRVTRLTYFPGTGNVRTVTDGEGKITTFAYDALNRLVSVTDFNGGITRYDYDEAGNLRFVHDANSRTTEFRYDAMNRLARTIDPLGRSEVYEYDQNGNLLVFTDRKGQRIEFAYDEANRLSRKILPGNDVTSYGYDALDNLSAVTDEDSAAIFRYDPYSRLIFASTAGSPSQPEVRLDYAYSPNGLRRAMTDSLSAGATNYAYDNVNRIDTITNPSGQVFDFDHDVLNRRDLVTLPNGATTDYTFDAADQLTSLIHRTPAHDPLSTFNFTNYDRAGNRKTLQTTRTGVSVAGTLNYTYDNLYRLSDATNPLPGGQAEHFEYDPVGNRLRRAGQAVNSQFDNANRLLNDRTFSYTYDFNGNLLTKTELATSQMTRYTWDAENQLTRIDFPNGSFAEYKYDGLGRRIEKTVSGNPPQVTRYVYDGEDILYEFDGSNVPNTSYVHGVGIDEPLLMVRDLNGNLTIEDNERFYYHTDGLGSVTDLTTSTGAVVRSYVYDSFGNIVQQSGTVTNPYTYTGRELDSESGLYYYRRRYYDPRVGRFLSEDPIGGLLELPSSIHQFNYVYNNPTKLIDPFGLIPNLVGITDGGGNAIFDPKLYSLPLQIAPSRLEVALQDFLDAHQDIHASVREMGRNFPLNTGFGYEYLAGVDIVGLGSLMGRVGFSALAEGTTAGILAGTGWVIVGGEIFWLGVDFFIGLSERNIETCPR